MLIKQTIQEYLSTQKTRTSAQKKEYEKTEKILAALECAFAGDIKSKYEITDINIEDLVSIAAYRCRFETIVKDVISSYLRDKTNAKKRIKGYIEYLIKNHRLEIDLSEVLPDVLIPDKLERQIDMLKMFHDPDVRRSEIADYYNISEVTASNDLSELLDGIRFMGQKVRLTNYKGDEYLSTVHPIFLPLNLSEVSALTIGLKELSKGSILENTYNYLADYIFSQLSDYGKQRIRDSAKQEGIYFNKDYYDDEPGYREEKTILESGRDGKFLYLAKSGSECEVRYYDDEGEKTVTGKIGWESIMRKDRKITFKTKDTSIEINMDRISEIKIVNYR